MLFEELNTDKRFNFKFIFKLFCFEYLLNSSTNNEYISVSSEYEWAIALKVIVLPISI